MTVETTQFAEKIGTDRSGRGYPNTFFNLVWGIHLADLRDWLPYRIFVCLFGLFLGPISYTGVYIW